MIEDFFKITTEVINLVKSQQIEKAAQLAQKTHQSALTTSFRERQRTVHEVTLALVEIQKQRDAFTRITDNLSKTQQSIERFQIEKICRTLFDEKTIELQNQKRKLSRPR